MYFTIRIHLFQILATGHFPLLIYPTASYYGWIVNLAPCFAFKNKYNSINLLQAHALQDRLTFCPMIILQTVDKFNQFVSSFW